MPNVHLRLGFVEFYQQAMNAGRNWLFSDLPFGKKLGRIYNASDAEWIEVPSASAASGWFGRYADWCGVKDPNVDFHALRGTFLTYGNQQGLDVSVRMELAGHSRGTHDKYIYDGMPLAKLKAEVDSIRYPIRIPRR